MPPTATSACRTIPIPTTRNNVKLPTFTPTPEHKILDQLQLPLAIDAVRYVGEAVAVVVAETLPAARDAAEAVAVEYDALPAVTDVEEALAPGAPVLWPDAPGNLALDNAFGDRAAVEAAMAGAHLVVEQTVRSQRTVSAFMEPRAALGSYDKAAEQYILISGCQGVHRLRAPLAGCLNVPPERVRVICPDVGGAFGSRFNIYPEQVAVVWAAKRLGRAVKWTGDRHEAFLTDYTARDVVTKARLGFDREGRMLALALELTANTGAHTVSYVPLSNGYRVAPTVYDVPIAWVRTRAAMTNTVPTAPFRGAGRPEATAVMERLLDIAAKRLQIDRVELRRRNLIPHDKFPHRTATGLNYDSGDFAGNLARVLDMADWDGFPKRRAAARKRGRLRGIGIVNYVETPVGMPHERVAVKVIARARRPLGGNAIERAGPRDQLPPGDGGSARRHARGDQLPRRRQRHARLGRRHPFRSLHAARGRADGDDVADGDRQGAPDRGGHARRRRERHRVHRRPVHRAQQQPAADAVRHCRRHRLVCRRCRTICASCARRRPSPGAFRPIRPAPRCARPRSIRRPERSSCAATPRSTTAARPSIRSSCTARCTAAWRTEWARR